MQCWVPPVAGRVPTVQAPPSDSAIAPELAELDPELAVDESEPVAELDPADLEPELAVDDPPFDFELLAELELDPVLGPEFCPVSEPVAPKLAPALDPEIPKGPPLVPCWPEDGPPVDEALHAPMRVATPTSKIRRAIIRAPATYCPK